MRLTKCAKLSLKIPDEFVEIHQSSGWPWNAYLCTEDGFVSFRTGLFWDFTEHLMVCKKCREDIGISLDTVKELLQEILETWERVTK